jgi:hypothetical protein
MKKTRRRCLYSITYPVSFLYIRWRHFISAVRVAPATIARQRPQRRRRMHRHVDFYECGVNERSYDRRIRSSAQPAEVPPRLGWRSYENPMASKLSARVPPPQPSPHAKRPGLDGSTARRPYTATYSAEVQTIPTEPWNARQFSLLNFRVHEITLIE